MEVLRYKSLVRVLGSDRMTLKKVLWRPRPAVHHSLNALPRPTTPSMMKIDTFPSPETPNLATLARTCAGI